MIGEVQYGGRITDDQDRCLFEAFCREWLEDKLFSSQFSFNSGTEGHFYRMFNSTEHFQYVKHIDDLPAIDSPEIFFLHPNADLTFREKESKEMITTLMLTQPKEGGGGAGASREDQVKDKCEDFLTKLPSDY